MGSTKGDGDKFIIQPAQSLSAKRYLLMEEIQFGERVQSFILKGQLEDGNWIELDTGSCIGHKRIGQISQAEKFKQFALHITESRNVPRLREFAIY